MIQIIQLINFVNIVFETSRTETTSSGNYSEVVYFFYGLISTLFFVLFTWMMKHVQNLRSRPILVFQDHCTDRLYFFGFYIGKIQFPLPSIDGKTKQFWAIQCKTDSGEQYIVPSHGDFEDLVKRDDDIPFLVLMEGKMLGPGSLGSEVHREWAENAFPKSVYHFDSIGEIPPNYWLCVPHWSVGLKKEAFKSDNNRMTNMFSMLHQIEVDKQAEIEIVFQKFESLLSTNFQTQTGHFFSHWDSFLSAWDALLKQYTTGVFTIGRLLHIRSSQISMAGINHAVSQGSIPAIADFIGGYTGMMTEIWDKMGYVGIPKDTLEMTFQKANKTKDEALMLAKENQQLNEQIQGLISQMRNGGGSKPQQQIDM